MINIICRQLNENGHFGAHKCGTPPIVSLLSSGNLWNSLEDFKGRGHFCTRGKECVKVSEHLWVTLCPHIWHGIKKGFPKCFYLFIYFVFFYISVHTHAQAGLELGVKFHKSAGLVAHFFTAPELFFRRPESK